MACYPGAMDSTQSLDIVCTVVTRPIFGAVPKWLRERSAKALCVGSNPTRTFSFRCSLILSARARCRQEVGA